MRGVYRITNKIDGKTYIGESLDVRRRWNEHIDNLNNNKHHSYKLQNAWNKYGEESFEFSIVCILDENIETFIDKYILLLYEYNYINKYDSFENGYNVELTLKEIIKNNRTVNDKDCTKAILKKYNEKIKNETIKEFGGIIYNNDGFTIQKLKKQFRKQTKNEFKNMLIKNNLVIKNEKNYILNESYFDKNDIISNENYSKIMFGEKTYLKLQDTINKIIEGEFTEKITIPEFENNIDSSSKIVKYKDSYYNSNLKHTYSKALELFYNNVIKNSTEEKRTFSSLLSSFKFYRVSEIYKILKINKVVDENNILLIEGLGIYNIKYNNNEKYSYGVLTDKKGLMYIYNYLKENMVLDVLTKKYMKELLEL